MANVGESLDRQERFLRRMREQNVDGLILCPASGSGAEVLRQIERWRLPCVQTLRHISARDGDYVGVDYQMGVEMVATHLVRLGHRRIAFLGNNRAHSALAARRRGLAAVLERHGLQPAAICDGPPNRLGGFEAVGRVMDRPDPPTAVVCYNDLMALGFMTGLQRRGLRPGRDVAVTGVDDIPEASIALPPLTTVATSPHQLGEAAARLLLNRIDRLDGPAERVVLPARLVVRASCGADQA
jgi:LacI family transcriptional regulator